MPVNHPTAKPVSGGFHSHSLLNPSEIEDFINSILFAPSSEEVTSMIPTILKHLKPYAYRDTYLYPPHYYDSLTNDLFAEHQAITPSSFNNTSRFYNKITDTIIDLKDMRLLFAPPNFM